MQRRIPKVCSFKVVDGAYTRVAFETAVADTAPFIDLTNDQVFGAGRRPWFRAGNRNDNLNRACIGCNQTFYKLIYATWWYVLAWEICSFPGFFIIRPWLYSKYQKYEGGD